MVSEKMTVADAAVVRSTSNQNRIKIISQLLHWERREQSTSDSGKEQKECAGN
jgi:hypothetical protein